MIYLLLGILALALWLTAARAFTQANPAVLARPKFAFPSDEIAAVLAMFRSQGELLLPESAIFPAGSFRARDDSNEQAPRTP